MKYVGDIVTYSVRPDSRNESYNSTTGISQDDVLRYTNYGQERLQSLILATSPGSFQSEVIIPLVANQESYAIPDRLYAGERIVNVEYSPTGQVRDYYTIRERGISYRNTSAASFPSFFIRRSGYLLLNPIPSGANGSIRVTYERQLDTLAFRLATAGVVAGAVLNFSSEVTSFTYNLSNAQYVCVSDAYGNVMLYNGVVSSYIAGTSVTFAANVSTYLVTGYTTGNLAGGYLTTGKFTTTHSKLTDPCERYLEMYPVAKMFGRDDAVGSRKAILEELEAIETDIVKTYQDPSKNDHEIQISDSDMLINNDRGGW